MRKFILAFISAFIAIITFAQESDTTVVALDEIVVSSFYSSSTTVSSVVDIKTLTETNYGQEPSNVFSKMPSIISLNDNGTEFGYGYFRIRGLDQTRINVSLDGCPWNEAEDYGAYFANSPDLLSSMQTVRVEKGTASSYNGIAGVAGGILLESVNIHKPQDSYVYFGGGSFNSFKATAVYNMLPQNGWGLHVRAGHQQTAGFRDFGFNSSQALTLKTGYKFNDKSSIDFLTMNGYHRNGQGWIGNTLEELAVNPRANGNVESETDNWFNIKFSNNNGWDWEYIIDDTVDILSPYDGYKAIKKDISAASIEDWARELNTYEKCRKHNDKIRENIEKTNEFRRKKYMEKRNKAEKFIKKFNDE